MLVFALVVRSLLHGNDLLSRVERTHRLERAGLVAEGAADALVRHHKRFWGICGAMGRFLVVWMATGVTASFLRLVLPITARPFLGALAGLSILLLLVPVSRGRRVTDRRLWAILLGAVLFDSVTTGATSAVTAGLLGLRRLVDVWAATSGTSLGRTTAEQLARDRSEPRWAVAQLVAPGLLTMVSAPPKGGKTTALGALLRAQQDGADWFGLQSAPLRWCYATEEDVSFRALVQRFGLTNAVVPLVLPRQQATAADWPPLVDAVAMAARKAKCQGIIIDTARGWIGQQHVRIEHIEPLRALAAAGWAVLVVHHSTKVGGEHGAGVAGSYAVVGALDILAELTRVPGDQTARALDVVGRYGCWSRTGRLVGHRYVAVDEPSAEAADAGAPAQPGAFALITDLDRQTKEAVRQWEAAGGKRPSQREQARRLGITQGAWNSRLASAARHKAAYLGSAQWKARREAVRARCGGVCEQCHDAPMQDCHHLSYAHLGDEPLDELRGLCRPCHRAAHPWWTSAAGE